MPTGKASYRITDAAPRIRFEHHQLETWNKTTRIYTIDDERPETAQMDIQRDIEVKRSNWQITTQVTAHISSDKDNFEAEITVVAKENDEVLLKRNFKSRNPRFPDH